MENDLPTVAGNGKVSRKAWWHLWHTTWGGAAVGLLFLTLFMSLPWYGNIYLALCGAFWAFLAGCFRLPSMTQLFRQAESLANEQEQLPVLLWGTARIFLVLLAILYGLIGIFFILSGEGSLIPVIYWASTVISVPWLLSALTAALYVNRNLPQQS